VIRSDIPGSKELCSSIKAELKNKGLGAGERAIAPLGFHEVSLAESPKGQMAWRDRTTT
jgi:hypothetical protein